MKKNIEYMGHFWGWYCYAFVRPPGPTEFEGWRFDLPSPVSWLRHITRFRRLRSALRFSGSQPLEALIAKLSRFVHFLLTRRGARGLP